MNVTLANSSVVADVMNQRRQEMINQRYEEIYTHELAHKHAGGSFAGDIVIERNAEGVPVGGHVAIQMPTLDKNNPQQTINHANTVISAAMAPVDPSDQDYEVANQARNIKQQAVTFMNSNPNLGKRLDIQA